MHAYSYVSSLGARADVELIGLWDDDASRGIAASDRFGSPFFESVDELLANKLDAVIVTSETIEHRPLVERAVGAGVKAILCEKPIATTREDAAAMVELCDSRGVFLATAFPCRYSPSFLRLVDTYRSGALGEILAIRATNHGVCPFGWFVDPEKSGGGAVIDHTVHVADLNRILLQKEAVEVYAQTGNNMYHQAWEDTGFLTITYEDGPFTTLDSSWSRPKKSFPTWGDVTMEVIGTAGVVQIDLFNQAFNRYNEETGQHRLVGWSSDCDKGLVDDFLRAAKGEAAPQLATGADGARALEVALAAYESARLSLPVAIGQSR
jgi:predicted dehydrogenase